jgi:ferredoxin
MPAGGRHQPGLRLVPARRDGRSADHRARMPEIGRWGTSHYHLGPGKMLTVTSEQGVSDPHPGGHRHGSSSGVGRGLISGLTTTARALMRPSHTAEYPDVKPDLPPRSRGVIALLAENCTSCMLCARECPDWCI